MPLPDAVSVPRGSDIAISRRDLKRAALGGPGAKKREGSVIFLLDAFRTSSKPFRADGIGCGRGIDCGAAGELRRPRRGKSTTVSVWASLGHAWGLENRVVMVGYGKRRGVVRADDGMGGAGAG